MATEEVNKPPSLPPYSEYQFIFVEEKEATTKWDYRKLSNKLLLMSEFLVFQMILKAIEGLNETNGSNKSSISRFIESTYGELPAGHSAILSDHLSKMKDSGELVFWKNNYTKADPNAPPRRGRGRPPKPKDPDQPEAVNLVSGRPRGRPPKDPDAPPRPPKVKASTGSGKPRGRPRKMARPTGGLSGSTTITDSETGRPTEVSIQQ